MEGQRGFGTRMLTAPLASRAVQPSDIRVVDDYGQTSHFIWRDPSHILAWAYHPSHELAFYLYEDSPEATQGTMVGTPAVVGKGVMLVNGHCTYLPGNQWILNDTYPDMDRKQHLYLYHVETGRRVPLGSFDAPEPYRGEWRCDLHPRYSPDGRRITIDSTHGGQGRQIYLIDVSEIVAS
jgi:Tol biopolymer transport system component